MSVFVRDALPEDMGRVLEIYAHSVLHGTATFEEQPPDLAEMHRRRDAVLAARLPYLVAQENDRLVGYAFAALYRTRSAYRYTAENSVYLAPGFSGRGIGRALLAELLERTAAAGYREMVAVIGDSANASSIGLHRSLGFRMVGTLQNVGLKFGRRLDTVIMQRSLAGAGQPGPDHPRDS
jgi:phosphinothricin acetyltransferase